MELIKQSYTIIGETPYQYLPAIQRMELAGRNCYKSEHRIHDDSAEKFISNIVDHKHLSVVEHSNFVLRTIDMPSNPEHVKHELVGEFDSKYIDVIIENGHVYIGGNYRAFMERFEIPTIIDLLEHWFDFIPNVNNMMVIDVAEHVPNRLKRITARFITDRAVLAEFTRHRPDIVFSVESQRYCAYRDNVTLVIPHHYIDRFDQFINDTLPSDSNEQMWLEHMRATEDTYHFLLSKKVHDENYEGKEGELAIIVPEDSLFRQEKAEEARSVLPNSTAVDMVVTASLPEWNHILNLRTTAAAYKQFRILVNPVIPEFTDRGWM